MSSNYTTFRVVLILSCLTVMNLIFLGFFWRKGSTTYGCSVNDVIHGVSKYIHNNGKRSLEDDLIEPCKESGYVRETKMQLYRSIRHIVEECKRSLNRTQQPWPSPLIVLFTTWGPTEDSTKETVHNITIRNWKSFGTKIQIVIFTNDTDIINQSEAERIQTLPIMHHAGGGAPVLKTMFLTVKKLYKSSPLFGYVNSDIIFTHLLVETLGHIIMNTAFINSAPLLMVGRRVNVEHISYEDSKNYSNIELTAKSRGTLFSTNAEDYFITNSKYPWDLVADVVIGRVAYDNYLVGHSICKLKAQVIDLTDTVLAVHQTTPGGGNFEGFKHKEAHYNNALFKEMNIVPIYETGFTSCAPYRSHLNFCGDVQISERSSFDAKCDCNRTVPYPGY